MTTGGSFINNKRAIKQELAKKLDGFTNAEVIRAYMMRAISPSAAVKLQNKILKNIIGRKKSSPNNNKKN